MAKEEEEDEPTAAVAAVGINDGSPAGLLVLFFFDLFFCFISVFSVGCPGDNCPPCCWTPFPPFLPALRYRPPPLRFIFEAVCDVARTWIAVNNS